MKFFDRVAVVTATTGTGTATLGAVLADNFFTFAEQGAADGDEVYYMLNEGGDVEIGIGTIGGGETTLSRDTVLSSRISGAAGTSKMEMAGAAQVRCVSPSAALSGLATEAFATAAADIHGLASKAIPVDADEIRIADSAASWGFKRLSFANLKAWVLALIGAQVVTPWVAYTPTFTAFGTVSGASFRSRRVGGSLEVVGRFTSGTCTATEARVSLGYNGTDGGVAVAAFMNSANWLVGDAAPAVSATTFFDVSVLATGGNAYVKFGGQTSTSNKATAANGSGVSGDSSLFMMRASIPIEGW